MAVPQMAQAVRMRLPRSNATAPSHSCAASLEAPRLRRASRKRFAACVPCSAGMKSDRKRGIEASERTSRMPPRVRKPVKNPRNPQSRAHRRSRSSCQAEGWLDCLAVVTWGRIQEGKYFSPGKGRRASEPGRTRVRGRNVGVRAPAPSQRGMYVVGVPPAHSLRGGKDSVPGGRLSPPRGPRAC